MIRLFLFTLFTLSLVGVYIDFMLTEKYEIANYIDYSLLTSIFLYCSFYFTYYRFAINDYISESFLLLTIIACFCLIRDYLANNDYLLYGLCIYFPVYIFLGTIHLEKFKKITLKKSDFINILILFFQYTIILALLFGLYDIFQNDITDIIVTNIYACIINYALLMTTLKIIYLRNINYLLNYISVFLMLIADVIWLYNSIFIDRISVYIIQNILRWVAIIINIYGIHLIIKN